MKITDKTGEMAGAMVVSEGDDIFGITEKGQIIRITLEDIKIQGRNTQGVKFITLSDGDTLKAVSRCVER